MGFWGFGKGFWGQDPRYVIPDPIPYLFRKGDESYLVILMSTATQREDVPALPWQSAEEAAKRKLSRQRAVPVPHPPEPRRPARALDSFKLKGPGLKAAPVNLLRHKPGLGKEIISELAGNQVFRVVEDGKRLVPVRTLEEVKKPRATMKGVAAEYGLSYHAVRRIARAYEEGGEAAVEELNWVRGRPIKNSFFTAAEIDKIVSRATLNRQLGMSMKARAAELSRRFKKPLKVWKLREFYRGRGVTLQVAKPRLGPETLGTELDQLKRIRQLQEDVQDAIDEELELFCIDECVFNTKSGKRSSWAPAGRPPEWNRR